METECLGEHLGLEKGNSRRLEKFQRKKFKKLLFSLNLLLGSSNE
jgi:hypothetical protein